MATLMTANGVMRHCAECGELYPLDNFCIDRKALMGHGYKCKKCRAAYQKNYRKRKIAEMADANHELHGTLTGYRIGCRCDRCFKAGQAWRKRHAAYVRQKRAAQKRPK